MNHEDDLKQETGEVQPMQTNGHTDQRAEEPFPLSQFMAELNTRFGTDFNEEGVGDFIRTLEERLRERKDLETCMRTMEPDEARPIFGQAVTETLQSVFEQRSTFYTKLTENKDVSNHFARKMVKRLNKRQKKNGGHDV